MPRSPESIARSKAWVREWQRSPTGRAYHAAWRAAHRESELRRKARWRAAHSEPIVGPLPALHTGHPLFDVARELVPLRPEGRGLQFPSELIDEDARSEAVLALLEGRDPRAAVSALRLAEAAWAARTVELVDWR